MRHDNALLEQTLAELAELSRRVADLTATVSALTILSPAELKASSGEGSLASHRSLASPPADDSSGQARTAAPVDARGSWSAWPLWGMPPIDPRAAPQSPASFLPLLHPAWGWAMPPQPQGTQPAAPWPAGADQATAEEPLVHTEPDAPNECPGAITGTAALSTAALSTAALSTAAERLTHTQERRLLQEKPASRQGPAEVSLHCQSPHGETRLSRCVYKK
jgi:hypothetical protein